MSKINFRYLVLVVVLYGFCIGGVAHAADVVFTVGSNTVQGDMATIVEVDLDPKGRNLNAIEGIVGLSGEGVEEVTSIVVETGGSLLTLWPVNPVYSKEEKVIRFTGGSPTGFTEKGSLFRMRIFSKGSGEITLSWLGGGAYQNDGEGTPVGVSSRSLVLALTKNEPNPISPASVDSVPPYFDELLVSKDQDVYDGKYFVSFHANDDTSGIARYEVVEGQATTEVTNGVYVLQDQQRKNKVVVIAYDQAGNSTSIVVPTKYEWLRVVLIAGGVLALVLIVLLVRGIPRRR